MGPFLAETEVSEQVLFRSDSRTVTYRRGAKTLRIIDDEIETMLPVDCRSYYKFRGHMRGMIIKTSAKEVSLTVWECADNHPGGWEINIVKYVLDRSLNGWKAAPAPKFQQLWRWGLSQFGY